MSSPSKYGNRRMGSLLGFAYIQYTAVLAIRGICIGRVEEHPPDKKREKQTKPPPQMPLSPSPPPLLVYSVVADTAQIGRLHPKTLAVPPDAALATALGRLALVDVHAVSQGHVAVAAEVFVGLEAAHGGGVCGGVRFGSVASGVG